MSSAETAAHTLQDCAILWSIGESRASDVVSAACDALVTGLDSPALRRLAACTRGEADDDVPELLPPALDELGLTFYAAGSIFGREAAMRAFARRTLAGRLTPRELAFRVHQLFGHRLPLAARLAELDDEYDTLEYSDRTLEQIDTEVMTEARRLAHYRDSSTSSLCAGTGTD
ncbi:hypothetical protein ACFYXS_14970 [Streptomyces sp. NPDC002574]|uniref:hypothetical protein n=1 Tax=Streptomyces sp. NPDC002574 TaxID=3364652 RepID=UPI0036AF2264